MTLSERIAANRCVRCKGRERFAGLAVCAACAEALVAPVKAWEPAWMKRLTAKELQS